MHGQVLCLCSTAHGSNTNLTGHVFLFHFRAKILPFTFFVLCYFLCPQNNDLAIARAKMSGLEEELKQMKAQSSAEMVQKLEQENALLKDQLTSV